MRVLVTGAYGLIGAACLGKLRVEGHDLIGAGRNIAEARRRFPYARWVTADFRDLTTPESWHELLSGIDAVVNCVGALQDGARDDLWLVHEAAPAALFAACEQKGVRRVVHVSAAGAGPGGSTAFARTKGETERDLSGRNLDWVDSVEKVPKCLLAISSKETKLSYARQLIWHPGRCRSHL
jgi:uncharacterized protein YbjT (DUF2867 family)